MISWNESLSKSQRDLFSYTKYLFVTFNAFWQASMNCSNQNLIFKSAEKNNLDFKLGD